METVAEADRARFEKQVFGRDEGDGSFDLTVRAQNDATIRLRGARAVGDDGALERLVLFAEPVKDDAAPTLWSAPAAGAKTLAAAAAIPAAAKSSRSDKAGSLVARALDENKLEARSNRSSRSRTSPYAVTRRSCGRQPALKVSAL